MILLGVFFMVFIFNPLTRPIFQYLGQWYEQKRFPAFFQLNTRCVRAEYGATEG
jgi:lipocalin